MKFAIVYRLDVSRPEQAESFDTLEAARAKAERLLSRHETKSVAIVKVIERANTEVTWTRL